MPPQIDSDTVLVSREAVAPKLVARKQAEPSKAALPEKTVVSREYLRDRSEVDVDYNWNFLDHIIWVNVAYFVLMHAGTLYGVYLAFTSAKWWTLAFCKFFGGVSKDVILLILVLFLAGLVYFLSLFGITAGVHRLWSHKAYKAKLPLRIILGICNSMAYQNSIYVWARDHRVHHKYSETNADPVSEHRLLSARLTNLI